MTERLGGKLVPPFPRAAAAIRAAHGHAEFLARWKIRAARRARRRPRPAARRALAIPRARPRGWRTRRGWCWSRSSIEVKRRGGHRAARLSRHRQTRHRRRLSRRHQPRLRRRANASRLGVERRLHRSLRPLARARLRAGAPPRQRHREFPARPRLRRAGIADDRMACARPDAGNIAASLSKATRSTRSSAPPSATPSAAFTVEDVFIERRDAAGRALPRAHAESLRRTCRAPLSRRRWKNSSSHAAENEFAIGKNLLVRLPAAPLLRDADGVKELLLPARAEMKIEYHLTAKP